MVYCCFWLAIVTSFSVGQAGTVRQVYRTGCHKSMRISRAVRFFFQFRIDVCEQLVRCRRRRLCRKNGCNTEPAAADQHLALPRHTIRICQCRCIPETAFNIAVFCTAENALLRSVAAEDAGVSINFPFFLHVTPFCLLRGAVFIAVVPSYNLRDRPRHDRRRFSFAGASCGACCRCAEL